MVLLLSRTIFVSTGHDTAILCFSCKVQDGFNSVRRGIFLCLLCLFGRYLWRHQQVTSEREGLIVMEELPCRLTVL
jgi:hypothetical protein